MRTPDRTVVLKDFTTPVTKYPVAKSGKVELCKMRRGPKLTYWAEGVRGNLYYKYGNSAAITYLKINGAVWMTDEYPYTESLGSFAQRARGSVLVAGLGLGIVVHQLCENPNVTKITVVERNKDVIKLVKPLLPADPRIEIVESDFYDFIELEAGKVRRDTVIWDLAVSRSGTVTEGREIGYVRFILISKYGVSPWYDFEKGEFVPNPTGCKDLQIFIHGLDRDPEGEAFVKTKEFAVAKEIISA